MSRINWTIFIFTSVHRIDIYRSSDMDGVTFPEQILAHCLTCKCQTEHGAVPANFLDKGDR